VADPEAARRASDTDRTLAVRARRFARRGCTISRVPARSLHVSLGSSGSHCTSCTIFFRAISRGGSRRRTGTPLAMSRPQCHCFPVRLSLGGCSFHFGIRQSFLALADLADDPVLTLWLDVKDFGPRPSFTRTRPYVVTAGTRGPSCKAVEHRGTVIFYFFYFLFFAALSISYCRKFTTVALKNNALIDVTHVTGALATHALLSCCSVLR